MAYPVKKTSITYVRFKTEMSYAMMHSRVIYTIITHSGLMFIISILFSEMISQVIFEITHKDILNLVQVTNYRLLFLILWLWSKLWWSELS